MSEQITVRGFRREHNLHVDEVLMTVTSALGAFVDEFVCHESTAGALLELNADPEICNYFRPQANGKGMGCC